MPSHASSSTTRRLLQSARAKSLYYTAAPRIAVTVLAMAGNDKLPISALRSGATKKAALLAAILILHALPPAAAQQPTANPAAANQDNPYNTNVSPALAILVVAIVSSFFLLGFFSLYLRRCTGDRSAVSPAAIAGMVGIGGGRSRRGAQKGLDSSVLETFPTMVYSAVKGQKLGKESLECAVCLCEFEDDDILRLLPRCSHVFHRDCIDIWLASHVTCPVCRSNLSITDDDPLAETDHVAVRVDDEGGEVLDGQDRQAELADLVRIGSQRREAAVRSRPGSVRTRPISSRSTVDWADVVEARGGGGGERFTLRLPDDLRRELLEAGKLRRSASFAVFPTRGEGSSRRGYREGMWRSLRIGRSGRWPFLGRNFSANGRGESAAAAAATAEGSVFGSSKSVRVTPAPMGGLNGGGEKPNYDATSSSTLTLKSV